MKPRHLPKARAQAARYLVLPNIAMSANSDDGREQDALRALGDNLRAAELYWVTPDMAALAISAGSQLAAARWATVDRPSACGLIMWDGGIGNVTERGVTIPVEGCAWGPYKGELLVWYLMSRDRLADEISARGVPWVLGDTPLPPLLPVAGDTLPITAEPVPMAELDVTAPPVLGALAAAWLLMEQPQLVDRTQQAADKADRRSSARAGMPDPTVTIVDLRRQYVPADSEPGDPGRQYRHRWVVSGHWRNQPYGEGREQRRRQWIPAYVKGPDGAPLLATERVNVWRR